MEKTEKTEKDFEMEFEEIRKKYDLPEFQKLMEDFDVMKIVDKESPFIVREIRRAIGEKLSAYLHLFETLINPTAPPMFVLSILRNIDEEGKKKSKRFYKKIAGLQLKVMKLDTVYSEKAEAEFVNLAFKEWQEMKNDIVELLGDFDEKIEENSSNGTRGYFG